MSIKITSSGNKNRYTTPLNESEIIQEEEKVPVKPVSELSGHDKRNFWLDYPKEAFLPKHNPQGLAEMTIFKIKFPQHRELYFRKNEKNILEVLKKKFISFQLDLKNGESIISTTRETFDPFIIVKAKLMIKCISRGVNWEKASDLLKDETFCDVINIKILTKNQKIFQKRRKRLFGPNGSTLKAIEILTNTFIVIMGGTVTSIGSVEGCREVRKVVEDCMFNVHPIYRIKQLMIMSKFKNDPKMKNQNWNDFLPKFTKKRVRRKNKRVKKVKRRKSFVIPPPQKRKIDFEMDSGEYFVKERERLRRKKERMKQTFGGSKRIITTPPVEKQTKKIRLDDDNNINRNVLNLKKNMKKRKRKKNQKGVEEYVDNYRPPTKKRKK